jgi:hypothetical protein
MNRRTRIASIAAAAILVGCAGQGDIDRTQPDKVEKSIFFTKDPTTGRVKPKVWYYRQVVTRVPSTTGYSFEGLYGEMYKVRFDITEKHLVAYRAHDYAPGTQNEFTTTDNNLDSPLAVWPISSHFDVQRGYIAGTGEQTNVIEENTSDKQWFERKFMRVDWTQNANVDFGSPMSSLMTASYATTKYWVSQAEITNPDRPIISKSYIDWTTKYQMIPDSYGCYMEFSAWDYGQADCGPAEIKVRNALMEVKPSSYEPKPYNNSEYSKFGIFRTVIQDYDRQAGPRSYNRRRSPTAGTSGRRARTPTATRSPIRLVRSSRSSGTPTPSTPRSSSSSTSPRASCRSGTMRSSTRWLACSSPRRTAAPRSRSTISRPRPQRATTSW